MACFAERACGMAEDSGDVALMQAAATARMENEPNTKKRPRTDPLAMISAPLRSRSMCGASGVKSSSHVSVASVASEACTMKKPNGTDRCAGRTKINKKGGGYSAESTHEQQKFDQESIECSVCVNVHVMA